MRHAFFPRRPVIFLKVYAFASLYWVLLRLMNFRILLHTISRPGLQRFFGFRDRERLLNYVQFALSHWPFKSKEGECLLRSLLLYSFFKPRHKDLVIVFGMKKENEKLKGHAWLELDGDVFLEGEEIPQNFQQILSYGTMRPQ